MKHKKVAKHVYLVRLYKGEEIGATLSELCDKLKIINGILVGIGSIANPTLAHYRVDTKKYSEKKLSGIFELTQLTGTVAQSEGKVFLHMHATASDDSMRSFGGHLVAASVSATCEVVLTQFNTTFEKVYDEEIGLKLWNLHD